MSRVRMVPFEEVDPELHKVIAAYDAELGRSEFVRVFAHAPEVFKSFIKFLLPSHHRDARSVDMRLTELARLKVAEKNGCAP
jgi:hypothetical protein